MTDPADTPLPTLVTVTTSFLRRLPTQRTLDLLKRLEPDYQKYGELLDEMPPRITAFRWLIREYPDRDPTSLWLHAYDVEVEVVDPDPTNGNAPTPSPPSALITS